MSTQELHSKITELRELKQMADDLAALIATLEDDLKGEMTARSLEELKIAGYTLRYKTIAGSRFDSKAFRKDFPDIADRYTLPTVSKRFTIG